jgi:short-subunit dehydrogenase
MTKIKDQNILITGGANGIGKMLGEKSLKAGAAHLVIWDINQENLDKTIEEFKAKGYDNVSPYVVDIANTEEIEAQATQVLADVGTIDILYNNAGVVVGKQFYEHSARDIDKTIQINVLGVMHTTRVFLPAMIEKGAGHVINIASAAGLTPNPKMSVYAASKWAVLGWSESLRIEMERIGKDFHVTTVTPSYINTGMFDGVKAPLITPILDPDDVTNKIIDGVKNNEILLRAPLSVNLLPILRGILPTRVFDFVGGNLFGIYDTMADFLGRPKDEALPEKERKSKEATEA